MYTAYNETVFVETSDASQSRHKSAPPVPVENRILDRRSSDDDNLRRIRSDLFIPYIVYSINEWRSVCVRQSRRYISVTGAATNIVSRTYA